MESFTHCLFDVLILTYEEKQRYIFKLHDETILDLMNIKLDFAEETYIVC